jgi:hypothetical protein
LRVFEGVPVLLHASVEILLRRLGFVCENQDPGSRILGSSLDVDRLVFVGFETEQLLHDGAWALVLVGVSRKLGDLVVEIAGANEADARTMEFLQKFVRIQKEFKHVFSRTLSIRVIGLPFVDVPSSCHYDEAAVQLIIAAEALELPHRLSRKFYWGERVDGMEKDNAREESLLMVRFATPSKQVSEMCACDRNLLTLA